MLRNLARNLRRLGREEEESEDEREKGGGRKVRRFFGGVEGELWFVFAHNKSLVSYPFVMSIFSSSEGIGCNSGMRVNTWNIGLIPRRPPHRHRGINTQLDHISQVH